MRIILFCIAVIVSNPCAYADPASSNASPVSPASSTQTEDWTVNGKTLHNVIVGNVYPDRVEITFDGGVGTPLLKDLPPELQKRFNYNPDAANAAAQKRDADQKAASVAYAALDAQTQRQQASQVTLGKNSLNSLS